MTQYLFLFFFCFSLNSQTYKQLAGSFHPSKPDDSDKVTRKHHRIMTRVPEIVTVPTDPFLLPNHPSRLRNTVAVQTLVVTLGVKALTGKQEALVVKR